MENKKDIVRKGAWLKIFLVVAMFFALALSTLLVSCGAKNIILTYETVDGEQVSLTVKQGTQLEQLGDAQEVTGYTFAGWYKDEAGVIPFGAGYTFNSNATIYAKYIANEYTITYHANNGSGRTERVTARFKDSVTLPGSTLFTYDGYTFAGWSKTATATPGAASVIAANKGVVLDTEGATYYAIWKANTYSVKFDKNANDATGTMNDQSFTYGISQQLTANAFARNGYNFIKWNTKADGTGVDYSNKGPVRNLTSIDKGAVTLYAIWSDAIEYTITLVDYNGFVSDTYDVTDTLEAPLNARVGYINDYWTVTSAEGNWILGTQINPGTQASNMYGNVTLTAHYTPIEYTITLLDEDGITSRGELKYTIEDELVAPSINTKAYYTNDYWTVSNAEGSWTAVPQVAVGENASEMYGNVTLTAHYAPTQYTITYNNLEGANNTANPAQYNVTDAPIVFADIERSGYTFLGWFADSTFENEMEGFTPGSEENQKHEAITVWAKWLSNSDEFPIIYHNVEGLTNPNPSGYNVTSTIAFFNVEKTGYTFGGWFADEELTTPKTGITVGTMGQVDVYAKWTPIAYAVAFDSNGGTGEMSNQAFTYDQAQNLTANAFSKTGYTFAGWAETENGAVVYADGESVSNLATTASATVTLYAKWTPITYNVVYNSNNGSENTTLDTVTYGETYNIRYNTGANAWTKQGYTFVNYNTERDGSGTTYTAGQEVSNLASTQGATITLYCQWAPITYTVAFDKNDADATGAMSGQNFTYGQAQNLTANAFSLLGHDFIGWATELNGEVVYANGASVSNLATTAGATVTLYAKWALSQRTIVLVDNTSSAQDKTVATIATNTSAGTLKYGDYANLASPGSPSGNYADTDMYTFAGWTTADVNGTNYTGTVYSGQTQITGAAFASSSTILYAYYTRNTVAVLFNSNGGAGSLAGINLPTKENYTFTETEKTNMRGALAKTGYTLAGFATTSNGSASWTVSVGTSVVSLYAIWQPITYYVSFNGNGSTGGSMANQTFIYDTAGNLTSNGFTKTDYGFIGWATSADGAVVYTDGQSVSNLTTTAGATVTLYAKWEEFKVNFKNAGAITSVNKPNGATASISSLQVGDTIIVPKYADSNLSYTGSGNARKYFAGWSTNPYATVPDLFVGETYTITAGNAHAIYYPVYMEATLSCLVFTLDSGDNTATACYNKESIPQTGDEKILIYPNIYVEQDIPYTVIEIISEYYQGPTTATKGVLAEGITNIGDFAFQSCRGLTSITIPSSVTSIGVDAFSGCSGLTSITIPDGVTDFGEYAFSGCSGLTSITIPDGVTYINDYAFSGCTGLTSITIPDGVTYIAEAAFRICRGLTSITIPDGVTGIGKEAFDGCSGLTSITIPESVTYIDERAFAGCAGLTSIIVASGNTAYHSAGNCLIGTGTKELIAGCNTSVIPTDGSVASIADYAFQGCSGLTSITIPDGVTYIGMGVFSGCSGLTSITIPDGVTYIADYAFEGCSGLTSITIPDGVTGIAEAAFAGCSGLTSITIPDGVTGIGYYAFGGCTSLTSVTFEDPNGWTTDATALSASDLSNPSTAATYLTDTYVENSWWKS